jgi:hypothetical protein
MTNGYMGAGAPWASQPKQSSSSSWPINYVPKGQAGGPQGQYYAGHTLPKPAPTPTPKQQPQVQQQVQQQQVKAPEFGSSGSSGFDWKSLIPQLPKQPVVTAKMIAEWLSRAKNEAGLMFDPQLMAITQELEKSLLASEASRGGIEPAYQEAIGEVEKWKEQAMTDEQKRWYSRGLGLGGGLVESERKLEETAGEAVSKLAQEKARTLSDIEKQESLLKQQAAQQGTGIEKSRSQYITARQSELRDAYEQNQSALNQQKFANQMQIAQFGLTAESQAFSQQLAQYELELDKWYKQSLIGLEQESMAMGAAFASGTGAGTQKDPYENMIYDKDTGTYITYPQYLDTQVYKDTKQSKSAWNEQIEQMVKSGIITSEEAWGLYEY